MQGRELPKGNYLSCSIDFIDINKIIRGSESIIKKVINPQRFKSVN